MLKKFIKSIFIILLILFLGITTYGIYNHFKAQLENKKIESNNISVYDKNEESNLSKIKNGFSDLFDRNVNSIKNAFSNSNADNNENNNYYDNSNETYDTYNFDDSILLYEGENEGKNIITLLDRLIRNADDSFYSNTTVTIRNLGSLDKTIDYSYKDNNIDEYKNNLEEIKNNVVKDDKYIVSFGYNKLKTHVNEVIIEKK